MIYVIYNKMFSLFNKLTGTVMDLIYGNENNEVVEQIKNNKEIRDEMKNELIQSMILHRQDKFIELIEKTPKEFTPLKI
jgi:hypothetical protein